MVAYRHSVVHRITHFPFGTDFEAQGRSIPLLLPEASDVAVTGVNGELLLTLINAESYTR